MTIASEIARLQAAKVDIMAALVEKGVDITGKNLVDVPDLIDSIKADNTIYEFDLNKFDISTLKDGNVEWSYVNGRALTLNKSSDYLEIKFTRGTKQYFALYCEQFNLQSFDKFVIEMEYGGSLPYMSYFGFYPCNFMGNAGSITGLWRRYNSNWGSAANFDIKVPFSSRMIVTKNGSYYDIDVYVNGSFVTTVKADYVQSFTHNVDLNGSSNDGTILLYKLKISKID